MVALLLASSLEAQQPAVALPTWLSGCWRQVDAGQIVDEVWLAPAGGSLLGVSRSVEGDSIRGYELMLIRPGTNGLLLEASPARQPPAAFLASAVTDSSLTFENLTHDFPQVIRYARRGGDSLLAMISGTVRDRQRTINFAYGRVSCPGP
jgi:hypothetical protein